jgi:hypothetical protein
MDKVVTAKSTQTPFDLALQLHGNVDAVFDLIEANPAIENVESEVGGLEISYELNDTYVQKFYIQNSVTVSSKPTRYRNTNGPRIKIGVDCFLLINNGYNILI